MPAIQLRNLCLDTRKELTKNLQKEADLALELKSGVRLHRISSALRCILAGNATLAKALGWKKNGDAWLDATAHRSMKKGYEWDETFGWIHVGERKRYREGEYFDLHGTANLMELVALLRVLRTNSRRVTSTLAPLLAGGAKSAKARDLLRVGVAQGDRFRI